MDKEQLQAKVRVIQKRGFRNAIIMIREEKDVDSVCEYLMAQQKEIETLLDNFVEGNDEDETKIYQD